MYASVLLFILEILTRLNLAFKRDAFDLAPVHFPNNYFTVLILIGVFR